MTDVAFYHLQRSRLEDALPMLLGKTLDAEKCAVVIAGSRERVGHLDGVLWASDPASWLPHGTGRDGAPEEHPIWLTNADENPNNASFLFLTDGATSSKVGDYERCFVMFDGNDPTALSAARDHWRTMKTEGHQLTYWKQGEQGWAKQDI